MTKPTSEHQLGKFIYRFQLVEAQVDELILLLANQDEEMSRIMTSELDFAQKLKTVDVMFARFADIRTNVVESAKSEFHSTVVDVIKLCERRNDLVHSRYWSWLDVDNQIGLLRQNAKLRGKSGILERQEEKLLPEDFASDLKSLSRVCLDLEEFRLRVIDWLFPDE